MERDKDYFKNRAKQLEKDHANEQHFPDYTAHDEKIHQEYIAEQSEQEHKIER